MRVVLADDSLLLREGVARLLEDAGLEVVAQAGDAEDLLRKVGAHKPDLAIVDVRMPPTHTDEGLKAAVDIRERFPETGVLVLSQYVEESYALELLSDERRGRRLPAQGPGRRPRPLRRGRAPGRGRAAAPWTPRSSRACWAAAAGRTRWPTSRPREREVLALMAEGRSNHAIADGARRHRARRREARHLDLLQARPAADGGRPPPGAGRADLPARLGAIHRRPLGGEVRLAEPRRAPSCDALAHGLSLPRHAPRRHRGPPRLRHDVTRVYGEGRGRGPALSTASRSASRPARFTAIMGPSGSGKSTLMHLLAGLDRPTTGSVVVDGVELTGARRQGADRRCAATRSASSSSPSTCCPSSTRGENILLPLSIAGRKPDDGVDRPPHRHRRPRATASTTGPSELSGGQQQRVAVARALATRPAVVFADEPTGNLDSKSSTEVLELLRRSVDDFGQTVIMVTHDAQAAAYADRLLLLADGKIVHDGGSRRPRAILDLLKAAG